MSKKINEDKIERDKKFLMMAGIIFFMSLIFVLWGFNMKTSFENSFQLSQSDNKKAVNFFDNFSLFLEDTEQEIKEAEQQIKGFKTTEASSGKQKTFLDSLSLQYRLVLEEESEEFIKNLKQELENKIKQ